MRNSVGSSLKMQQIVLSNFLVDQERKGGGRLLTLGFLLLLREKKKPVILVC